MTTRPHPPPQLFTEQTTRPLLEQACRDAGLDCRNVLVLRHHSNAVYLVGKGTDAVVVKIARPGADPDRDLREAQSLVTLTDWLTRHNVPATTLLAGPAQPLIVEGHAVTLWQYLPQRRPVPTAAIAGPLRALHQAPLPPIRLPELDPPAAILHSIDTSPILTPAQRDRLRRQLDTLTPAWTRLIATSRPCLIHTDPQHRNTLWHHATTATASSAEDGTPTPLHPPTQPNPAVDTAVLCDLDGVTVGPVEWDLVTIDVHCRRFGHPDHDAFCTAYGRDIRDWPGYRALRDLRELRMITTNARKSMPGSPGAAEVARRIARLDDPGHLWRIL